MPLLVGVHTPVANFFLSNFTKTVNSIRNFGWLDFISGCLDMT
jgi:hypothetical protein